VGGNYRQFKEALALLPGRKGEPVEDRQARALVLATRPEHRREAIRQFEGLAGGRGAAAPEVRLLLARLYEADGDWPRARGQLLALLGEQDKSPVYLAYYVRALLRHRQADEAESWVKRLAEVSRPTFEAVELQAWVFHANGKASEALTVARRYYQKKGARLDLAGGLLEQLGRPAEGCDRHPRTLQPRPARHGPLHGPGVLPLAATELWSCKAFVQYGPIG
jgi:predicted Zn-dependent protease